MVEMLISKSLLRPDRGNPLFTERLYSRGLPRRYIPRDDNYLNYEFTTL